MGLHLTAMVDTVLNDPDVLFGQGRWMTTKTDEVSDAGDLQHLHAVAEREAHKDIARKQRHLQMDAAVFPAADGVVQRQEVLDSALSQLLRHALLVIGIGVNGVPEGLEKARGHVRIAHLIRCVESRGCHAVCLSRHRLLGQLRPVTYRGVCDLTHLELITYSKNRAYFSTVRSS